jgi:subtilase family serine protease
MFTNVSRRGAALIATIGLVASLVLATSGTVIAAGSGFTWSHRDADACAAPGPGQASCNSVGRTFLRNGAIFSATSLADLLAAARAAASPSFSGSTLRTAYGVTAQGSPSSVIAIVDAYDNPNAGSNLATFRSNSGLPAIGTSCTTATIGTTGTPCFLKVNQTGGSAAPTSNAGWAVEIDLDLQAASSICPNCSILLVEANSNGFGDLGAAVTEASNVGHVVAISNSYGGGDQPGSIYHQWDDAANKGIAVFASTGDGGYGTEFPASATKVIGVGGTTLNVDGNGARTTETVWSGAGSGCSTNNAAPSWQVISGSPCGTKKAVADLSADADPGSGLNIYTNNSSWVVGWHQYGGTSLASPIMASFYALQGYTSPAGQYAWAPTTAHFDVTSGSNGSCTRPTVPAVVCNAGVGWDGPTGLGSIQVGAVVPTAPAAPTLNSATAGNAQVSLAWTAPSSNGGATVTGYAVYRSTTPGGEGSSPYWTLGNVTTWTDTNVTNGTTYSYKVAATNSVGTGGQSGEKSATPTAANVPAAPGSLTAKTAAVSNRGVRLNWTTPSNGGSAITGFNIYRSTSSGAETKLTTAGKNATTILDSTGTSGVTYFYKVTAVNKNGEGPLSNEASAKAR